MLILREESSGRKQLAQALARALASAWEEHDYAVPGDRWASNCSRTL